MHKLELREVRGGCWLRSNFAVPDVALLSEVDKNAPYRRLADRNFEEVATCFWPNHALLGECSVGTLSRSKMLQTLGIQVGRVVPISDSCPVVTRIAGALRHSARQRNQVNA